MATANYPIPGIRGYAAPAYHRVCSFSAVRTHAPPPTESILPEPVLVVEDEPLLQHRLRRVLSALGYPENALLFSATLAQARSCLEQQSMAQMLVDLHLPDGDGLKLIAQLRADDPDVGMLEVSAWSSEEAILGALRAGPPAMYSRSATTWK